MTNRKNLTVYLASILFAASILFSTYHILFNKKPLVSVVMPTYNRADLLPRSIESILYQTFQDFEFIIVDDGSTDNSVELIKAYQQVDPRIKLIQNDQNYGISHSRNRGMDAARGKYLAIMDSDDYSEPNRLEKSLRFLKKHPDYTAVNSIYYETGTNDKGTNNWVPPRRWEIIFNFANYYTNIAMIDLKFTRKHNLRYDESLISGEDYDFWARMWTAGGKLGMINEPLIQLRRHSTHSKEYYDTILRMRKVISARLLARFGISEKDAHEGNRCKLMYQMIQKNPKVNIVNQYTLEFTYNKQCGYENVPKGTLYIKHFDFVDNFYPIGKNMYIRAENKELYEKIEQNDRTVIFKTPQGVKETYYIQNDGSYAFIENL